MSHCIFVREYVGSAARSPIMLAYDIPDRDVADALAQSIAQSYSANGTDHSNKTHWFYQGDQRHEIYTWPHEDLSTGEHASCAHHVEERYPSRGEHVSSAASRQGRHRSGCHFG